MSKKKVTSKKTKPNTNTTPNNVEVKTDDSHLINAVSHTTPENDQEGKENGGKILGITIIGLIVLFVVLLLFTQLGPGPQTTVVDFHTLYQKTLDGFETENNFIYNEFVFVNMIDFWQTILLEKRVFENHTEQREVFLSTHYSPLDVQDIPLNQEAIPLIIEAESIFMSYPANLNQDYVLAGVEIGKILGTRNGIMNKPVTQSVHGEYEGAFPIITCDNATRQRPVILFTEGEQNEVAVEGYCIKVIGENSESVIKSANRLLFRLVGVMVD